MSFTLEEALKLERLHNYERCENPAHGFGKDIIVNGKTAPCKFMICPVVQFYPQPSYQFHSVEEYLKSTETLYRKKGLWPCPTISQNVQPL